jgi:hypothetical protein
VGTEEGRAAGPISLLTYSLTHSLTHLLLITIYLLLLLTASPLIPLIHSPTTTPPRTAHHSLTHSLTPGMKLVTWNVDGLCDTATTQRTLAALELLLPHSPTHSLTPPPKPDVIFLQEVVPHTEHLFTRKLVANGYHSAAPPPSGAPYYTMCYYNPHTIKPVCVRGQQQQYQQGQDQQEQGHRYQQDQDRYQQQQGAGGAGGGSRVQYTGDARSQMVGTSLCVCM